MSVPLTKYEHIVAGDGMSFLMQIYPKLDPKHLTSTLSKLLEENPTLRSNVIKDQMYLSDDTTPDLEYVKRDELYKLPFDIPTSLSQRLLALSSTDEYKFRNGKQIRFLAHDFDDSTLLDMHFSHQCADGLCVITNAERFMQLLDPNETPKPKELKSITSDWMKAGNMKYKDSVKPFNFDTWKKFETLDLERKDKVDYKNVQFHHMVVELTPDKVKRLINRARKQKATIMGVVWAASAMGTLALKKHWGQKFKAPFNLLYRTPVNLRGIYPEFKVGNADLTFGSFPILVPMKTENKTRLWEIASYTRNEMMKNISTHEQERQFFCHHAMADVNAEEPANSVNATSIGAFKFQPTYKTGHSVIDAKLMVTYALKPENALLHVDCFSTSHLGMAFNFAYSYPVIRDTEALVYKNAIEQTLTLMTDFDNITYEDVARHLNLQ